MPRHVFVLPIAPETRHARDDQPRVDFQQVFGVEAGFLEDAGAERVD